MIRTEILWTVVEVKMSLDGVVQRYLIAMLICNIVSATATLTVIVPLLCSSYLRRKPFTKIAGFITLSEFLDHFFKVLRLTNLDSVLNCQLQAFFSMSFGLSSVFWMMVMTHFLYRIIVRNHRNIFISWIHHAFCWGIPIALAVLPLFFDLTFGVAWYDKSKGDNSKYNEVLTLMCTYGPTHDTSRWMIERSHLATFFVYALWAYLCVFTMIFEVIMCYVVILRLLGGDIRLDVTRHLLYPSGVIFSKVT